MPAVRQRDQSAQRHRRGTLLRAFLRRTDPLAQDLVTDADLRGEAAVVRRTLGAFEVERRHAQHGLGELLQVGLRVALVDVAAIDRAQVFLLEKARRALEIGDLVEGGQERLERVGQDRLVDAGPLHPGAQHDQFAEAEAPRRLGARHPTDQRRFAARQRTLAGLGIFRHQPARGDEAEDGVTEELQPFVRDQRTFSGRAGMHERRLDRRRVRLAHPDTLEHRPQPRPSLLPGHF